LGGLKGKLGEKKEKKKKEGRKVGKKRTGRMRRFLITLK